MDGISQAILFLVLGIIGISVNIALNEIRQAINHQTKLLMDDEMSHENQEGE